MSSRVKISLEDVRAMAEDVITPAIAGDVLGCTGFLLGQMCHKEPEKVPFPFICIGNKTIIPRVGFIRWAEGRSKEPFVVKPGDRIFFQGDGHYFPMEGEG